MKNAQISPRERQRQALDEIMVHNPTNEEFRVAWDRVVFRIPPVTEDKGYGSGNEIVKRYIAENYVKHMTDKILGEKLLDAIQRENKKRVESGMKPMDKFMGGEEDAFAKQMGIGTEQKREEIFPILWKGVYKAYGFTDLDMIQDDNQERDDRSFEERMADKFDQPVQIDNVSQPATTTALESSPEPQSDLTQEAKNEAIADVSL